MTHPIYEVSKIALPNDKLTRIELIALKAYIQGLSSAQISQMYLEVTDGSLINLRDKACRLLHNHSKLDSSFHLRKGPKQDEKGIKKAIIAIDELQDLARAMPEVGHPVEGWFIAPLSRRLSEMGIQSLGQLVQHINEGGSGWWKNAPKIGRKGGLALLSWVQKNASCFDLELKEFIRHPNLPVLTSENWVLIFPDTPALAPLERIRTPRELDGSNGANRGVIGPCYIAAMNDYEAINTWLERYKSDAGDTKTSHTYRAYRKEAERFLLWALAKQHKPMSSLFVEDILVFKEFLSDPQPAFTWVGSNTKRGTADWRPFQGPLSNASKAQTMTILQSMFEWFVAQNYLGHNPFASMRKIKRQARIQVEKGLSIAAWNDVIAWVKEQEGDSFKTALLFLLFMRDGGLRRTEVVNLKRSSLIHMEDGWKANFEGKGGRWRMVPLSKAILSALEEHLATRNLTIADMDENLPLISPKSYLKPKKTAKTEGDIEQDDLEPPSPPSAKENLPYTEQGLWKIIKRVFTAYDAAKGSFEGRDLSKVRPHALRHSHALHAVELGVPIEVIQQNLGHTSLGTTTIYLQGGIKRRTQELNKLFED